MFLNQATTRKIDVLVLTDVQLGKLWTSATLLNLYFSSVEPRTVVLLGNFFNPRAFTKSLFANAQNVVIEQLLEWSKRGIAINYVVGETDAVFQKFVALAMPFLNLCPLVQISSGKLKNYLFFTQYDTLQTHAVTNDDAVVNYIVPSWFRESERSEVHLEKILLAPSWQKEKKILELVEGNWSEKLILSTDFTEAQKEQNAAFTTASNNRRKEIFSVILNNRCEIEDGTKKNTVERNQLFP